mgnify:CR=1 FL=1
MGCLPLESLYNEGLLCNTKSTKDVVINSPEHVLRSNLKILFIEDHLCEEYKYVF